PQPLQRCLGRCPHPAAHAGRGDSGTVSRYFGLTLLLLAPPPARLGLGRRRVLRRVLGRAALLGGLLRRRLGRSQGARAGQSVTTLAVSVTWRSLVISTRWARSDSGTFVPSGSTSTSLVQFGGGLCSGERGRSTMCSTCTLHRPGATRTLARGAV